LGAFAHCCKNFPQFKSIPIYATAPVISLGRALLQDIYAKNPFAASTIPESSLYESSQSKSTQSTILLQPPNTEEIAEYFNLVHPLKFSQPHEPEPSPFSPSLNGLTVTAYSAGHSLGGTIWHIQHGLESIVYAVDWNQAKDSALQAAAWLGAGGTEVIESLRRPTALVCSSRCSQRALFPGGRAERDQHMLKLIKETVAKGGSVLIPTDTCGRSLELAYFLEDSWEKETASIDDAGSLKRADAIFASVSGGLTMRLAKSMLEWMDPDIVREFEVAGQNNNSRNQDGKQNQRMPFDFKHIRFIERTKQLQKVFAKEGPKVILASDFSMEWGFARPFFEAFCAEKRNLVILPEPVDQTASGRDSISHTLWGIWSGKAHKKLSDDEHLTFVADGAGKHISYTGAATEKLGEKEAVLYQQYLAREKQKQWSLNTEKITTLGAATDDIIDDNASSSSEESEESDGEQQGKVLNVSATLNHSRHKAGLTDAELGIDILIRKKGHYDYDVRGKKGRERMFPVLPAKRNQKFDDYGEVIRPEDYLRAEEKEEQAEQTTAANKEKEAGLGQKRKWGDVAQVVPGGKQTNGSKRRRVNGQTQDENVHTDSGYSTMGNGNEFEDSSDDSDDEAEAKPEGPSKAVFTTKKIKVYLRIAHVDFSGLHDRRSMQFLIPLINPRKLILIGGNPEETTALQTECAKLLNTSSVSETAAEIFTPNIGETLDASVDTNAWNVKLSVPLRRTLHWQTVGGLGVVPLTGHLDMMIMLEQPAESTAKRIKGEDETTPSKTVAKPAGKVSQAAEETPMLGVVPTTSALSIARIIARPLHVGDLRLSDLRKVMQASGVSAEFRGEGTLLVNGQVAVRKSAVGKIEVESVIGMPGFSVTDDTFDKVRRRIYDSLALISGSGGF
jgi:cleavage and polyadenylation specificity factor subunit 2